MTKQEFVNIWGTSGNINENTRWWLGSLWGIIIGETGNFKGNTLFNANLESVGFKAWNDFLLAMGLKPIDPRKKILEDFGFVYKPESNSSYPHWKYKNVTVNENGGCTNMYFSGYEHLAITNAEEAKSFCDFLKVFLKDK